MRFQKYRGMSISENRMLYGLLIENDYTSECFIVEDNDWYIDNNGKLNTNVTTAKEVEPSTLNEFTGLYDKFKRQIYTNDILEIVEENGTAKQYIVSIETVRMEVAMYSNDEKENNFVEIRGTFFIDKNGLRTMLSVDENGVTDLDRMSVIGNLHETGWDCPAPF